MHLFMGCFWLVIGIGYLFFWPSLAADPRDAGTMSSRSPIAIFCFVMFSYNFVRWRLAWVQARLRREAEELPPRPRVVDREIDPAFDFSETKPQPENQNPPPSV